MGKKGVFDVSDLKFVGWNIVVAIIVAVVILVVLILWLNQYTQHGVEVEVADVRGMVEQEAGPILSAQGLLLEVVDSTYSDKVPLGTIVEQDPKPLSHAKPGRLVYVTINAKTKRMVTMPNLHDMSYRQAMTTLRGLGLRVDSTFDYKPSQYRDLVLDVKSGGESVQPGKKMPVGTRVRLVVGYGQGTETTTVPHVIGLTLQEARGRLLRSLLIVGAVYYDGANEDGSTQYVYRQSPGEGDNVIEGTAVTLYLSPDVEKAVRSRNNGEQEEDTWF